MSQEHRVKELRALVDTHLALAETDPLPRVREQHLRAAQSWQRLAEQVEALERNRKGNIGRPYGGFTVSG